MESAEFGQFSPNTEEECDLQYGKQYLNESDLFCPSIWDSIYCWPPTLAGSTVQISCKTILSKEISSSVSFALPDAKAFRACNQSGFWVNGNWTNYTQCLSLVATPNELSVKVAVGYILFLFSFLSVIMLLSTMVIFVYFKSLDCPRLRVHRNLVAALLLNAFTLIVISCPLVLHNVCPSLREADTWCKLALSLRMYAGLSSINWMFIEGLLLHSRVTTSIFKQSFPFRLYYLIGWVFPLIIILIWAQIMSTSLSTPCWEGYGKLNIIWLITAPMIIVLVINLIFLINIIRILVTRLKRTKSAETNSVRKAIRAAILLFPLLGSAHLLFFFNPKVYHLEAAYMLFNALLQSSQGLFVSLIYCFFNKEVQKKIKRAYVSRFGTALQKARLRDKRRDNSTGSTLRTSYNMGTTNFPNTNNRYSMKDSPGSKVTNEKRRAINLDTRCENAEIML